MAQQVQHLYEFGEYRLDAAKRLLSRNGSTVQLTPKCFEILLALIESSGEVVDKNNLIERVWPDRFVEEGNLTYNISVLRKALGERAGEHQYIVTIPGRGYQFVASVRQCRSDGVEVTAQQQTGSGNGKHRLESEAELHSSTESECGNQIIEIADQHAARIGDAATDLSNDKSLIAKIKRNRWSVVAAMALIAAAAAAVLIYTNRGPALTEKDTLLIADFVNTTGDSVFDGTLKQALAVQLEQSPFLNIFPEERVRETLRYMGRSADEQVSRDVAREICERQGIKAILTGSISSLGSHYVIGLEAINVQTGDVIAREQIEAESKEQVLQAVGKATTELREKLGESLRSIKKFNAPIEQATTASLEAFKAFSLGRHQQNRGRNLSAIPHFKHATELDPDFALAHSWLAAAYGNTGQGEFAVEPAKKSFALRDRVSEREKFRISGIYYRIVTKELDKQLEILELWNQTYPDDYLARASLAAIALVTAKFDRSIEEGRACISLNPSFAAP